jgi:hypothetical protein
VSTPDQPPGGQVGGRIGARIADLVAQTTVATKARMAPHTAQVAQTVLRDFTNHVSDEIRGVMAPLWTKYADDEATPDELRPLFTALATQTGQAWGMIGGLVTSAAFAGGLVDLLSNELAPITHKLIASNPHNVLSPQDAAVARTRGLAGSVDVEFDMAAQGFDEGRRNVLEALAESSITPDVVLDLVRRKTIGHQDARNLLGRLGYREVDIDRLLTLAPVPLSPADAAAAWARSELTEAQTDQIGALAGVSTEDMRIMRALAGQPPSPEELLFAQRRGIINADQVRRGIIQGPIRNEWIPVVEALQWLPLPVSEAANAVNQGHLTQEQGTQAAVENGFKPETFQVIVDNAGIPPGPQEALDWVNRELITEDEFRTIFLESRIKNKYIDLYLKARYRFLTLAEIRLLVSRGALSTEDAIHKLQQIGFTADDAASIVDGASKDKTAGNRDLTVTQVRDLYADQLITRDDLVSMLVALGYDEHEAGQVADLADLQGVHRFVSTAINRIKAAYVSGKISGGDASGRLDTLGLPAAYKDTALALWDIERTTVSKTLTVAQVVSAVKKGVIGADDGRDRIVRMGYTDDDAAILLTIGGATATG